MPTPRPRVLEAFPYPIAYPYSLIFAADEKPSDRLWALCFTQYQLLRLVGLTLVCQYLRQPQVAEDKPDVLRAVNKAVAALRAPFFSDWLSLLYNLRSNFPRLNLEPVLPQLGSAMDRLKIREKRPVGKEPLPPLEAIIHLRNSIAHGGLPDQNEAARHLAAYLPVLHQVLEAFDFLAGCRLAVWCGEDADAWSGYGPVQTLRGYRVPAPVAQELPPAWRDLFLESRAILVTEQDQAVPLLPFFNPVADREPLYLYDGHFGVEMPARGRRNGRMSIIWERTTVWPTAVPVPSSRNSWPAGTSLSLWKRARRPPGPSPTAPWITRAGPWPNWSPPGNISPPATCRCPNGRAASTTSCWCPPARTGNGTPAARAMPTA
ncbi:MAG: hypothetical protein JO112_22605 [Planctomycetes bacterium]|nr:hypothetical protein [Planctomycetota bacterium]